MAVLVTGAAGFIGLNTIEFLVSRGKRVIGIDNFVTSCREICDPLLARLEREALDFYKIDLQDYLALESIFQRYDIEQVIHLAAIPSVPRSVVNPAQVIENNIMSTLNVLECCRKRAPNLKKIVYAGSSSYYGGGSSDTTNGPLCRSPYAASKASGELLVNSYFYTFGLPTTVLRYFNVFGPYQNPNSQYAAVIPIFIKKLLRNESPLIYGDGLQSRDFTYVTNVAFANYLAAESDVVGKTYNVGCGENITLLELLQTLNFLMDKKILPIFAKEREGDVKCSKANITSTRGDLKYFPSILLHEGLKKTVEYYRSKEGFVI